MSVYLINYNKLIWANLKKIFIKSSKKEFYASLNEEQRKFVDYLLDEYYLKGYDEGRLDERVVTYYERY